MDDKSLEELLAAVEAQTQAISEQAMGTAKPDIVEAALAEMPATANTEPQNPAAEAAPVNFNTDFEATGTPPQNATVPGDVGRLLSIEVPVIVKLGQRRMPVGEVMRLAVGAIVEFGKSADDDLELLINNKLIGMGNAVKVSENFGIKITKIGSIKETIKKLGADS